MLNISTVINIFISNQCYLTVHVSETFTKCDEHGQTTRQTDGQTSRTTIGSFFSKKENY